MISIYLSSGSNEIFTAYVRVFQSKSSKLILGEVKPDCYLTLLLAVTSFELRLPLKIKEQFHKRETFKKKIVMI